MSAAPNAVSWVPLTPSPESMSKAAGSWLRAKPNNAGNVPPPLLKELSSAAATAEWFRVRPLIRPMPDARFNCTSAAYRRGLR